MIFFNRWRYKQKKRPQKCAFLCYAIVFVLLFTSIPDCNVTLHHLHVKYEKHFRHFNVYN